MSAHQGRGAAAAAGRELRRYGHLRAEIQNVRYGPKGRLWISPAWSCWTELFELGERVHEEYRRAGVTYDPRTWAHGVSTMSGGGR